MLDLYTNYVVYLGMKKGDKMKFSTSVKDVGYGSKSAAFKDMKDMTGNTTTTNNTLHNHLSELVLNDFFKATPDVESSDTLYDVMGYDDLEDSEYYLD